MAYFINYCRQIVDLDKDQDLVELSYSKYIEGFGYEKFTDYFKTKIIGTSNEIVIQGTKRSVRYERPKPDGKWFWSNWKMFCWKIRMFIHSFV